MADGTVRWFNSERGYGFIVPDGGFPDVRVHYSEIQVNGYKTLDPGDRVTFAVVEGRDGGRHAVKVTPLGDRVAPPGAAPPDPAPPPAGTDRPARVGPVRWILVGLATLLMLGSAGAFVVVGMVRGEEAGAVFLLLALGFGGLLAWVQRDLS